MTTESGWTVHRGDGRGTDCFRTSLVLREFMKRPACTTPVTQYVPEIRLVHNPPKTPVFGLRNGEKGYFSPSAADGARAILARRRALPLAGFFLSMYPNEASMNGEIYW